MLRKLLLASAFFASTVGFGQDYVETWRESTPPLSPSTKLAWQQVAIVPGSNDVVVAGIQGENAQKVAVIAKLTSAGDQRWSFTDASTIDRLGNIAVDSAGNVTFSTAPTGAGSSTITSLNAADGSPRWTRTFNATNPGAEVAIRLAARSAGNSSFLYACVSEPGSGVRINRLNAGTGQTLFFAQIDAKLGKPNPIIDPNGNLIAIFDEAATCFCQKFSQSLGLVFRRTLGREIGAALLQHPDTQELAVVSRNDFFIPTSLMQVLNPTSGQILKTVDNLEGAVDFGDSHAIFPRPSGAWAYQSHSVEPRSRFYLLGNNLDIQKESLIDVNLAAADFSGQLHSKSREGAFALLSFPKGGTLNPTVGQANFASIAVDGAGRVVEVGSQVSGNTTFGFILQAEQKFLAGTDVFSEPFTTRLDVTAPGVLANDTLSVGGVLTVVTTTTKGTLTLAQDGSFSYVPGAAFNGSDQFSYRVTVGGTSRTATCFIKRLTFSSITFSPTTVVGGDTRVDLVVTFSTATSSVFRQFRVDSNRPEIASLFNPFLPITPGAISTSRPLTTALVQADQPVVFTTSALSGQTRTGTLIVRSGSLDSVAAIDASPVYEELVTRFRVKLQSPASGQAPISLFFRETSTVTGPASVTPVPGSLFADFTIRANAGTAGQTVKVFAFREERSKATGDLPILAAPKVQSVVVLDGPVYAGVTHHLELTLDKVAGNTTMRFFNETRPDSVGFLVPDFAITSATKATSAFHPPLTSANKTATVTTFASSPTEPEAKTTTFLIRPNLLDTFTISPITISAFGTTQGRVTFNWVATGTGIKVKVSTTTPTLVAVPNEVTMLPGRTVLTFPIAGRGKTGNAKVTVSVGDKAITKGITITQ